MFKIETERLIITVFSPDMAHAVALRAIPGVGEKTEQKLLRHFKSLKRIQEASREELTAVVGPKLASLICSTE